ncbi:3-oxoacyl-[acyl-carrier-protein] reductase FabG [Colletotrichum sidae]|uniref:3-oxoacyl-[acyl-carrier-protein] reductase FabG n=2 Tax=Colletotrichum orbiculare species complex TaxID=2707354 RepID=A0A4R8Q637_9PEZI|nr:3-oxoacyl-[acyl-carrier-protein] reductase FabG [Colletotrichum spinosum]TEA15755.1 3-oxoacyl-[acyl-carrier-protein] reductase FabG [Colletotrichum sidae]
MPVFCCTTPAFRLRMPMPSELDADPPLLQSQLSKVLSQQQDDRQPSNQIQHQHQHQRQQSSQLNHAAEKDSHDGIERRSSSNLWTKPLPQLPPPNMSLSGKVAIVTGGARGIGAAIALKLAREAKAHEVISEIEACGSSATAIQADVSKHQEKVVKRAMMAFGVQKIDILVNNAAATLSATLDDTSAEDYDRIFDTNTRAVFFMMQAAKPHIAQGGRIINISSVAARADSPGSMAYAGSKAAVEAFTRVAAREMGQAHGVTVNCISPGTVKTEMFDSLPDDQRSADLERATLTPAEARLGAVEDIADVVAFVASDESRWITGTVIPVNGGRLMN